MKSNIVLYAAILLVIGLVSAQNCGCSGDEPCCSQYGYCGTTAEYCDTAKGCKEGCWSSGSTTGSSGNGGGNGGNGGGAGNVTSLAKGKVVIYILQALDWNNHGKSLNVPGKGAVSHGYNVINLAFYTSTSGAEEMAQTWAQLSDGDKTSYLNAYHKAGMKVMVSLFGGADAHVSKKNAADFANKVVSWVKQNRLDGVDVDYEDEDSFSNGSGAQWLITLQKTLRAGLPKHIITHAPQAPHFSYGTFKDNAYITVHKAVGNTIDWYNVQFYNNGGYEDCNDLMFHRNGYGDKSSALEIISNIGVPKEKMVIGKPVGTKQNHDADNGFMDIQTLVGCIKQAKSKGYEHGGIMGWELFYDANGNWGNTAATAF